MLNFLLVNLRIVLINKILCFFTIAIYEEMLKNSQINWEALTKNLMFRNLVKFLQRNFQHHSYHFMHNVKNLSESIVLDVKICLCHKIIIYIINKYMIIDILAKYI